MSHTGAILYFNKDNFTTIELIESGKKTKQEARLTKSKEDDVYNIYTNKLNEIFSKFGPIADTDFPTMESADDAMLGLLIKSGFRIPKEITISAEVLAKFQSALGHIASRDRQTDGALSPLLVQDLIKIIVKYDAPTISRVQEKEGTNRLYAFDLTY